MGRKKLLALNTSSSLIFQLTTIICGFIVPRLILQTYGSEINGLINSIMQFLAIISFLELGVGAVIQSSLYKPLAEKNDEEISKIVVSGQRFFSRL
ncbi:MAG: sugar isomerase, partial [Anaerococcus hydrogenalis]|nr:sugar isomerase [Anaerococcus hydrogenalis]